MTSFGILGILYVIILSFTVFLVVKLVKKGSLAKSLQQENSNLKEKVSGFRTFIPGRKGLLSDFRLVTSTQINFKVDYEVEILEVSEDKVKVSAYDFTTNESSNSFPRDPSNRATILGFFQNQWVTKSRIELLVDKTDIRDSKIEQILS